MKVCKNCVLPETFPHIRFEDGICNSCLNEPEPEDVASDQEKYRIKFEELLARNEGSQGYDCLVCYSGGKDSTYTLDILRNRYDMRILAYTLDNGFVSPDALGNIKHVVENLGVDHIIFKPRFDLLRQFFQAASQEVFYSHKSLERASTICTTCIGIVKFSALKLTLDLRIPFIGYGWSPGQAPVNSSVMKTNPFFMRAAQDAIRKPLQERFGDEINAYFLEERHFKDAERFPHTVHPLAFLEYDESKIFHRLSELGWKTPGDTDANSSNCLLNAFANRIHLEQFGFHPYVWEIANMVRRGILTREEGMKKIYSDENESLTDYARHRLSDADR